MDKYIELARAALVKMKYLGDVEAKAQKIAAAVIATAPANPKGYIGESAFRAVVDFSRREAAAGRRLKREVSEKLYQQTVDKARTREAELRLGLIREAYDIIEDNPQHERNILVAIDVHFEEIPVPELMAHYGVSRDVVYQAARRGALALIKYGCPLMKQWFHDAEVKS